MRIPPWAATMGYVGNSLTASLTDLVFIAVIPTILLVGWLIVIFRATRDYDRRD